MTTEQLKEFVQKSVEENPAYRETIYDLWDLYLTEIEEEGASQQHQAELCYEDIKQVIEEKYI